MLFSSITFLYFFLPITCVVYFVMPEKGKNVVLLLASLLFYFWGEPKYCILLAVEVLLGFLGGILLEKCEDKWKKIVLGAFVGILLLLLVRFKYTDFLIGTWNGLTGQSHALLRLALPLGISFYTFQIVSYFIDVYRGKVVAERNMVAFAVYAAMFPQLVAGPIVRYESIREQLAHKNISMKRCGEGCSRFVMGLAKKVLIADILGELVYKLDTSEPKNIWVFWCIAIAYTLQIYYDFSGYSDMAIGLGKMLGFDFPENFNYPFISKSITEFWRRWHMTLGGWFRDYLYIPLGGNRVSVSRFVFNVLFVWFFSGLWHGASWNFVFWGLYFGVLLLLEKGIHTLWKGRNAGIGIRAICHVYACVAIVLSFVLFRQENLSLIGRDLCGMFTVDDMWSIPAAAAYEMKSYALLLAVAVIGATPLLRNVGSRIKYAQLMRLPVTVILLLLSTAFLLGSTVHPFLYFRF